MTALANPRRAALAALICSFAACGTAFVPSPGIGETEAWAPLPPARPEVVPVRADGDAAAIPRAETVLASAPDLDDEAEIRGEAEIGAIDRDLPPHGPPLSGPTLTSLSLPVLPPASATSPEPASEAIAETPPDGWRGAVPVPVARPATRPGALLASATAGSAGLGDPIAVLIADRVAARPEVAAALPPPSGPEADADDSHAAAEAATEGDTHVTVSTALAALHTPPVPSGSAGCGLAAPPAPASSILVDGRDRGLIVALPEGYDPTQLHRLVLAFHGRTNSNEQVRRYYGLEGNETRPTIHVYPAGIPTRPGQRTWWNGGPGAGETVDYALFDSVVARMQADYCIDETQIFAVGHSLGGSFVASLACYRGDLLRGVAIVGGGFVAGNDCRGELAALLMHNPADDLSLIEWGESARDRILELNGLRPVSMPAEPATFNCRRYGPIGGPNPVVWCEHGISHSSSGRYYPHTWPAGAGAAIIAFFDALDR